MPLLWWHASVSVDLYSTDLHSQALSSSACCTIGVNREKRTIKMKVFEVLKAGF